MHDPKGYYKALGLEPSASSDDIKKAYQKLIKEHHPDLNQGSEESKEKTIIINEAYETLSDNEKKSEYDNPTIPSEFTGQHFNQDFINFGVPQEFFNFMHREQSFKLSNSDQHLHLQADIESLFDKNKNLHISYKSKYICDKCSGEGCGKWESCSACNGNGVTEYTQVHGNMRFSNITQCGFCHGKGKKVIEICQNCSGFGTVDVINQVVIENVYTNYLRPLKFFNQGHKDKNSEAPNGDLYVKVDINIPNNGQINENNYDIYLPVETNVINFITENTIYLSGIHNESHLVKLECSNKNLHYKVGNAGIPVGEKRSDLYFMITPIIEPVKNKELADMLIKSIS